MISLLPGAGWAIGYRNHLVFKLTSRDSSWLVELACRALVSLKCPV